jgi:hypothetical protein
MPRASPPPSGLAASARETAHGGHLDHAVLQGLGEKVGVAVRRAQTVGRLTMTSEASSAWERVYGELQADLEDALGDLLRLLGIERRVPFGSGLVRSTWPASYQAGTA